MQTTRRPFDLDGLVRRSTSGRCFVCEFISGNPDYDHILVAETESAVAFLNKYPTLFGSMLVAPRQHVEDVTGSFSPEAYSQPAGLPLEQQQYYALMHENGVVDASDEELRKYATDVKEAIQAQARDGA